MREIPPIETLLNPMVRTYDSTMSIDEVLFYVRRRKAEHAPVTEHGRVIGLADEVLLLRERLRSQELGSPLPTLGAVCRRNGYVLSKGTRCDDVFEHMARERISAVLITDDEGILVGIMSVTDICTAFADFLRFQYAVPPKAWILR